MKLHVRPDRDLAAERLLQVLEHRPLFLPQRTSDVGIDSQYERLTVEIGADFLYFRKNLVADRRARLDDGAAGTVRARLGEHALEALLDALPRDDHQTEVRHLQRL